MRLINANAFLDFLRIEEKIMEGEEITFDYVRSLIVSAPTIEAKPVVHAHWNQIANGFMVCSHCEEPVEENRKYSFCPLCGAQMDSSEIGGDAL